MPCLRLHFCIFWVQTGSLSCFWLKELRKQEEAGQLIQPVIFVLLVLVSVLLYFAVSLMDPGFILSDDSDLQVPVPLSSCTSSPYSCRWSWLLFFAMWSNDFIYVFCYALSLWIFLCVQTASCNYMNMKRCNILFKWCRYAIDQQHWGNCNSCS